MGGLHPHTPSPAEQTQGLHAGPRLSPGQGAAWNTVIGAPPAWPRGGTERPCCDPHSDPCARTARPAQRNPCMRALPGRQPEQCFSGPDAKLRPAHECAAPDGTPQTALVRARACLAAMTYFDDRSKSLEIPISRRVIPTRQQATSHENALAIPKSKLPDIGITTALQEPPHADSTAKILSNHGAGTHAQRAIQDKARHCNTPSRRAPYRPTCFQLRLHSAKRTMLCSSSFTEQSSSAAVSRSLAMISGLSV